MDITTFFEKFPTNEKYELIDVLKIETKQDPYRIEFTAKFIGLKSLDIENRTISISYSRLFVIGSIWQNGAKVIFPNNWKIYQIGMLNHKDFDPEKSNRSAFNLPNHANKQYNDIVVYKLKRPIFIHKKIGDIYPLNTKRPPWNTPIQADFFCFYSHEIFRYFYTSNKLTDLNEQLLSLLSYNNEQWPENEVFNIETSKIIDQKYCIDIKQKKYEPDALLIGNLLYLDGFKKAFREMQNNLNQDNYYYLNFIDRLPFSAFEELQFRGEFVTRKKDGAKGLMIHLVTACKKYSQLEYCVLDKISENNAEHGKSQNKVPVTTKNQTNKEIDTIKYSNTSRSNNTHEVDGLGLEFLTAESKDLVINKVKINIQKDGNGLIFSQQKDDDNSLSAPGAFGDSTGNIPKITEVVEQKIYFDFFDKIVAQILVNLRKEINTFQVYYMNENADLIVENHSISLGNLSLNNRTNAKYVKVICVNISNNNFYLFEVDNGHRTWLYFKKNLPILSNENITSKINYMLFEKHEKSTTSPEEISHFFNHKQTSSNSKAASELSNNESIENHALKISRKILSQLDKSL